MEKIFLFTPGISKSKIEKGLNSNADSIIIDLEDAVVTEQKDEARDIVLETLSELVITDEHPKIYLRINPVTTPFFFDDIYMINKLENDNLAGIMIPKSEDRTSITLPVSLLNKKINIIPLIESAAGVYNLEQIIKSSTQVTRVAFGSVDYALDLGVDWSPTGEERDYAMSQIVVTSRALGIEPPIDAVYTDIHNEEKFTQDTAKGKQVGFYGKLIIHPKHIDWVNQVYKPTPEQVAWSRKVVDKFESGGHSGAIDLDGKLIDKPVYILAKRLLSEDN